MATRTYVVGLPVSCEVSDDGTIRVAVDLSELSREVSRGDSWDVEIGDDVIDQDVERIDQATEGQAWGAVQLGAVR